MHASTFLGLDGRPIVLSIPSNPLFLSLGRVVPAPHTRHLLGLFAAIAQNSLLRSFSIVDSLASRQHSCRGSEELAIRKTARFQATPNYSELLRVGGAQELLLRATPSYSELLRATPSHSERLLRATRALKARIDFAGLPSYSKLLRAKGAQELRATQSQSQLLQALRAASWRCKLRKGCPKQRVDASQISTQSLPSPELQVLLSPMWGPGSTLPKKRMENLIACCKTFNFYFCHKLSPVCCRICCLQKSIALLSFIELRCSTYRPVLLWYFGSGARWQSTNNRIRFDQ